MKDHFIVYQKIYFLLFILSVCVLTNVIFIYKETNYKNGELKMCGKCTEKFVQEGDIEQKVKALDDLKKYIENLPFSSHEKQYIFNKLDAELSILEYTIIKELGEKELKKIRQKAI